MWPTLNEWMNVIQKDKQAEGQAARSLGRKLRVKVSATSLKSCWIHWVNHSAGCMYWERRRSDKETPTLKGKRQRRKIHGRNIEEEQSERYPRDIHRHSRRECVLQEQLTKVVSWPPASSFYDASITVMPKLLGTAYRKGRKEEGGGWEGGQSYLWLLA